MGEKISKSIIKRFLGKYPGRTLHRLGTALGGLWITSSMINLIWPLTDLSTHNNSSAGLEWKIDYASKSPTNIIIIGVSELNSNFTDKKDLSSGKIKLENLSLIKIYPKQAFRFVEIPSRLKLKLPIFKDPKILFPNDYKVSPYLRNNSIPELFNLSKEEPQFYLTITEKSLSTLINKIGGIKISLDKTFKLNMEDKEQSIFLPATDQKLDGSKVSKILFYNGGNQSKSRISMIKSSILQGFWTQLKSYKSNASIIKLSKEVLDSTKTNLNQKELTSLTLAIINSNEPPILEETSYTP